MADPIPILCRALLLLRINTGLVNELFSEARIDAILMRSWWEKIAYNIGVIESIPSGIDSIDLHADVTEALQNIFQGITSINSTHSVLTGFADDINIIKQFQRVCFWGLGL